MLLLLQPWFGFVPADVGVVIADAVHVPLVVVYVFVFVDVVAEE